MHSLPRIDLDVAHHLRTNDLNVPSNFPCQETDHFDNYHILPEYFAFYYCSERKSERKKELPL